MKNMHQGIKTMIVGWENLCSDKLALKNLESHHIEENEQVVCCCGQQANAILGFIIRRIYKYVFIYFPGTIPPAPEVWYPNPLIP